MKMGLRLDAIQQPLPGTRGGRRGGSRRRIGPGHFCGGVLGDKIANGLINRVGVVGGFDEQTRVIAVLDFHATGLGVMLLEDGAKSLGRLPGTHRQVTVGVDDKKWGRFGARVADRRSVASNTRIGSEHGVIHMARFRDVKNAAERNGAANGFQA